MLFQYLERTQQLLNDLREVNFNTYDLTNYINIARGQLAGSFSYLPLPEILLLR